MKITPQTKKTQRFSANTANRRKFSKPKNRKKRSKNRNKTKNRAEKGENTKPQTSTPPPYLYARLNKFLSNNGKLNKCYIVHPSGHVVR